MKQSKQFASQQQLQAWLVELLDDEEDASNTSQVLWLRLVKSTQRLKLLNKQDLIEFGVEDVYAVFVTLGIVVGM